MEQILLAYYGDDFTGSTDALEFICRAGAKTVLFIEPPSPEQLEAIPGMQAFGVAGNTRALAPAEMEKILIPAFEKLKASGAKHVHYKVCSTFDSSLTVGSIGKALECGAIVFNNQLIPILGGMPSLGRYCLFGNLFARMGIGSQGNIYRLDRHPSMSKHPVTPANESDLRLHVGNQTSMKIGLMDILDLELPVAGMAQKLEDAEAVIIDVLYEEQLLKIGTWLEHIQQEDAPLFSVGTSGIEMALGKYWNKNEILNPVTTWNKPGKATPLLVISGSCSLVTASQIAWAIANGFEEIVLDPVKIDAGEAIPGFIYDEVNNLLGQQLNVLVHTGLKHTQNLSSEKLGTALGSVANNAVVNALVKRVVFSGGDTSSYAARAMGIEAVEMIAPLVIGAPLCRVISANKIIDGLEVNFKGGQVGSEDYFGLMAGGMMSEEWSVIG